MIFGIVGSLIALIGWFVFHSLPMLIVGTVCYIIETLLEWKSLNTGAKCVDVFIFGIGALIALFVKAPFYIGGMIALNCYSAFVSVISLPGLIMSIIYSIRRR